MRTALTAEELTTLLVLLLGEGGLTRRSKIFKHGNVILSMMSGLRTSTDIMNNVITVKTKSMTLQNND